MNQAIFNVLVSLILKSLRTEKRGFNVLGLKIV